MQYRTLVDKITIDIELASLGVIANLVYDRLLTITDCAGVCISHPTLISARCFPLMDEMGSKEIGEAIEKLLEAQLIFRIHIGDSSVLCFPPDKFSKYQKYIRRDFRRHFGEHGKISEAIWDSPVLCEKLFRYKNKVFFDDVNRTVILQEIEPSKRLKSGNPPYEENVVRSNVSPDMIYAAYPKFQQKEQPLAVIAIKDAIKDIKKNKSVDDPAAWLLDRVEQFAGSPAGNPKDYTKKKFVPKVTNWFKRKQYNDEDSTWYVDEIPKPITIDGLQKQADSGEITEINGVSTKGCRVSSHPENGVFIDGELVATKEDIEKGKYTT